MVRRIRDFCNSRLNAPSKLPAPGAPERPGRRGGLLERWLSGPSSSDPLYLTNRSFFQKARLWLLIGIPSVAVAAFSALSSSGYFQRQPVPPAAVLAGDPASEQLPLPSLDRIHVNTTRDIDLLSVEVSRDPGTILKGRVRNNTDRHFRSVDLIFDLTDAAGSQLGAISIHLPALQAKGMTEFHQALEQKTAVNALIRDVRAE